MQGTRVRVLGHGDWAYLRSVRLRALRDSPDSLFGNLAQERTWRPSQWRSLLTGSTWFAAFPLSVSRTRRPVGVVRSALELDPVHGPVSHLESMWVEPRYRRNGIASALTRSLVAHAAGQGIHRVTLWVLDGNDIARSAYLRLGFRPTGRVQPVLKRPGRTEEEMFLELPRGPDTTSCRHRTADCAVHRAVDAGTDIRSAREVDAPVILDA